MASAKPRKSRSSNKPQRYTRITYRQADRQLFPEMARLVEKHGGNAFRAALELGLAGQVLGQGTLISKAKRLAQRFVSAKFDGPAQESARRTRAHPTLSDPKANQQLFAQMLRIMAADVSVFQAARQVLGKGSSERRSAGSGDPFS